MKHHFRRSLCRLAMPICLIACGFSQLSMADSDYVSEATWLSHLQNGVYHHNWINPGVFDEEDNFVITDSALQKVANFLSHRRQSSDMENKTMRFATDLGDNQIHVRMVYSF